MSSISNVAISDPSVLKRLMARGSVILTCSNENFMLPNTVDARCALNLHVAVDSKAAREWNMSTSSRVYLKEGYAIARSVPPLMFA